MPELPDGYAISDPEPEPHTGPYVFDDGRTVTVEPGDQPSYYLDGELVGDADRVTELIAEFRREKLRG